MPIVAGDIDTYLSGGVAQSDPNAALGGVKSAVEWTGGSLHDLFDVVTGLENEASEAEYRAIYVQNNHATLTALGVSVFVLSQEAGGADLAIAIADEAINATIETIANENTAPSGPTFSTPTTEGAALVIGDLDPGEYRGLWIRRTATDSTALADDGATLRFVLDTEE